MTSLLIQSNSEDKLRILNVTATELFFLLPSLTLWDSSEIQCLIQWAHKTTIILVDYILKEVDAFCMNQLILL